MKLALTYSDGVIQNSAVVNEDVMKFAQERGIPVLGYQGADDYASAFDQFYDLVWESESK